MFGKNIKCDHKEYGEKLKAEYKVQIEQLKEEKRLSQNNFESRIRILEFDKDHLETVKLKEYTDIIQELKIKVSEIEAKNQMLDKIVDLNADIFDVKNLINQLIGKLPEIKLDKLSIINNNSKEE